MGCCDKKRSGLDLTKERAIAWARKHGKNVMVIFQAVNGFGFYPEGEPTNERPIVEIVRVDQ